MRFIYIEETLKVNKIKRCCLTDVSITIKFMILNTLALYLENCIFEISKNDKTSEVASKDVNLQSQDCKEIN